MWQQIFDAPTMNAFTSPSRKGPLSNVATVSWQIGWPY